MNRPPERLADGEATKSTAEQRAGDLLRTLRVPPRFDAAADSRLKRRVAQMDTGARPGRRFWIFMAAPAALALAIFVVAKPGGRGDDGIRSRGPEHRSVGGAALPDAELLTFRIGQGGRSEPLGNARDV